MNSQRTNEQLLGAFLIVLSYVMWGILPAYWKLLSSVPPLEVLGHRVIWCVVFLLLLILLSGRWPAFRAECSLIISKPKRVAGILISAVLLNVNWGLYIWAVINGHVIDTSLGYYINPLISVLLGMIFLREKLNIWQYIAFFLAALGVLNLTLHFGALPWIALVLAITFALYGLVKKLVAATALTGLALETMVIAVPLSAYLARAHLAGHGAFVSSPLTAALLIGAGIVTGLPLLLFSAGALRLSLTMVGFFQYISPTIALLLGIFAYHEPFSRTHLISFVLIWIGLAVFMLLGSGILSTEKRQKLKAAA